MRQNSQSFGRGAQSAPKPPGIRPALFYGMVAALALTNGLTLVGLLMSPDISRLVNGQNERVFSAYEDRIAQLRVEVDRLQSRQYAQAGDLNLQLQDLQQQQDVLTEQHQYVKALVDKAAELGIAAAPIQPVTPDPILTGALDQRFPGRPDIAKTAYEIQSMMQESQEALTSISDSANASTQTILAQLGTVGIHPDLPGEDEAIGGPFLPAVPDAPDGQGLADDANAVMNALLRFKAAKAFVDQAPIHAPLTGKLLISSGFGNRKDPFGGYAAFHSGLDFPQPSGTLVLAAGAGTVTFAGEASGYGNMLEIDHGNGLVTRYGHLSAFIAKVGQVVQTGTPIAKVGSTGRSTGPHLHFEVRRDNQAVNPQGFLNAGKALARFVIPT